MKLCLCTRNRSAASVSHTKIANNAGRSPPLTDFTVIQTTNQYIKAFPGSQLIILPFLRIFPRAFRHFDGTRPQPRYAPNRLIPRGLQMAHFPQAPSCRTSGDTPIDFAAHPKLPLSGAPAGASSCALRRSANYNPSAQPTPPLFTFHCSLAMRQMHYSAGAAVG